MLSQKEQNELKKAYTDKELKTIFKKIASKNPNKFFPTNELQTLGYMRKQCKRCGTFFWTVIKERTVCGDPTCSGGFQVVNDNPSKVKLSFIEVWKKIVELLEPRGYKPINRYPCVARWNPTSEFTIASISAFQPYVVTGEVEPPAKKLLIPQFCLRFNDIENVGITGSHNTGFVMIGQHAFVSQEEWNQNEFFIDIHDFIHKVVGLPKEEITIHEDSWAGGGNFGCSLEFFSRGVELFNQVYMMFEQKIEGPKELKLKVLDMGLGQERVSWFSQGTPNIYEATFPYVLSRLRDLTKFELDLDLYNEFSKYSAYLNIDEVDDMELAWQKVAEELKIDVKEIQNKIIPMTALYSIAEHARTLLFAIHDGKLPSNVGGGYNLRVIFRRAISFIDQFKWNIEIPTICEWHAQELKEIFPEVSEHLDEIREILEYEKEKYYANKEEAKRILENELKKGPISTEKLIELYDSKGINPELVKETAKKFNISIKVPDNFYRLVVDRHEKQEQGYATQKEIQLDLSNIPEKETKSLYYYDYTKTSNKATVLKIINNYVILDQSVAYPTSGGQLHDIGTINGEKFKDVFKQGNYIVHTMEKKPSFKEGETVIVDVDKSWRTQLSQHHTATHIVNAAARQILGEHVNQAGAKKTLRYSHLDITHYTQIPDNVLKEIENKANQIVEKKIDLNLSFIPRSEAEYEYGMSIYQGGAAPGKNLRIVEIPGVDVEACGGTHLNNTYETGKIKIVKSQKVQDGIVRLTFTAGKATEELQKKEVNAIKELQKFLNIPKENIVGRVNELIGKWKKLNKALQTGIYSKDDMQLSSYDKFKGDILSELSRILNVKKEKVPSKIKKFYDEWAEARKKLEQVKRYLSDDYREKLLEKAISFGRSKIIIEKFKNLNQKDIQNISSNVLKFNNNLITLLFNEDNKGITITGMIGSKALENSSLNMGEFIKNEIRIFEGKGGGKSDYGQGFIDRKYGNIDNVVEYLSQKIMNKKKS
ncbi:MAG: alanine--tRNA ligase [Promethearchaeota archaeon]